MSRRFIAVDWGTTRLRAYLVEADGAMLASHTSDSGVQSVAPGGFPAALRACCGPWLAADPGIAVTMAGMVGSRNGWVEAPYASTPCGLPELAAACHKMELDGHALTLVPGVDTRWPARDGVAGAYDVMRGEETKVIGLGLEDGLVCLPGTHSKWVRVAGGRITGFATFITGELYAAMTASFVARLATEPEQAQPAMAQAQAAAGQPGGLSRALFQARTRVLGGDMPGAGVKPFLSALLVGEEIAGAQALFPGLAKVHLVAGDPQLPVYLAALQARGLEAQAVDPETALLTGLAAISRQLKNGAARQD